MKKLVLFLVAILLFKVVIAQNYRMQVIDNQQQATEYDVSTLRSLMFPDADLQINLKSGAIEKIAKSNVKKITFYLPASTEQTTNVKVKIDTSEDHQFVRVDYPAADNANFAIYSIDGRARLYGQLTIGRNAISVSNLPAGIYLFKTTNTVLKFIKK